MSPTKDLREFLERKVYPRLTPEQIYNHHSHNWLPYNDKELRGGNPWRDSHSGESFVVNKQDLTWYLLGDEIGGDPVKYRWYLRSGLGAIGPHGKNFIEIVEELAALAGVAMPERYASAHGSLKASNNLSSSSVDEELGQPNQWHAPESYNGEIGYWRDEWIDITQSGEMEPVLNAKGHQIKEKVRRFHPLCDFDFSIEREFYLPSGGGGYVLRVRRSTDGYQGRVIVSSSACKRALDFEEAIEKGLGVDVSCNLKTSELKALFGELRLKYTYREGRTYLLADRCGQQANGTWVFKDCQFTKDGDPITENESLIIWNPMMGDQETIPSPELAPQNPEALPRLVSAMQKFFGENFMPALFALGYGAAAMHFQRIMGKERFFPILNLYGDAGTGKTIAGECALSLFGLGWIFTGSMSRVSISALYEWGRLCGSMLLLFDDPTKQRDLDEEESSQDSLTHFLGVLQHALGESLVGSWNLKLIKDESGGLVSLAIEVGVFKMLDTCYRFPYSAKVIKTLIQQAGGKTRALQRFHKNKDLSQAYERALLAQSKTDANSKPLPHEPPDTVPRRCWEIPAQLVMDYIQLDEPSTPLTLAGEIWQL